MSVAGTFHPADPDRLREVIDGCFEHELGPGHPGEPTGERSLLGLVVPHAGYRFSGPVAAHAYKALAEDGGPETAVVVASTDLSHVGRRYGQTGPDGTTEGGFARQQDERVLEAIEAGDLDGFYTRVFEEEISMCGYGAVGALLSFAGEEASVRRLAYATTQDVEDADVVVGYAALRVDG